MIDSPRDFAGQLGYVFTPHYPANAAWARQWDKLEDDDSRLVLWLSARDRERFSYLPRDGKSRKMVKVTDLATATQFWARPSPCGAGCYCGAFVTKASTKER